jgi:hypothetical protein
VWLGRSGYGEREEGMVGEMLVCWEEGVVGVLGGGWKGEQGMVEERKGLVDGGVVEDRRCVWWGM